MHKHIQLINKFYLPKEIRDKPISDQYVYLKSLYSSGNNYFLLNNTNVFGPYPKPEVPWDISEVEKIVIYQEDVAKVNKWLLNEIFEQSALFNYKTLDVLIRIATGMLNKCNISKGLQIMFHDNMVRTLMDEYGNIRTSDLPF